MRSATVLAVVLFCQFAGATQATEQKARNLVFLVPDGMGPAQVTLARGFWGELAMDEIYVGRASVGSTDHDIPDSAATATAMATGVNSYNSAIGVDDDEAVLSNLFEAARARGLATGFVVVSSIQHATPASFTAHVDDREKYREIAMQQIDSGTDLMLGGGAQYLRAGPVTADDIEENDLATAIPSREHGDDLWYPDLHSQAREAGYSIVTDAGDLNDARLPVLGIFAEDWLAPALDQVNGMAPGQPTLAQMTTYALEVLSEDEDGFVLLVEGSMIDGAGHYHDPGALVHEVRAFDEALAVVLEFAVENPDTLVVSMADHETGGLSLGTMLRPEEVGEKDYSKDWNDGVLRAQSASVVAMVDMIIDGGKPVTVFLEHSGVDRLYADEEARLVSIGAFDLSDDDEQGIAYRIMGDIISSRARVAWATRFHTGVDVGVYAFGPGADAFRGYRPIWDVGRRMAKALDLSVAGTIPAAGGAPANR